MNEFWEESLPAGYYDKILTDGLKSKKGIQANWHHSSFTSVRSHIKKGQKHLDYACGPGTFIGNYNLDNSYGVDIAVPQIEYANNKYKAKGKFDIINKEQLKNENYDVITVIGLLEFIDNEEIVSILDMLYSLINDKGKLILTTPNYTISMRILEKLLNILGQVNYKNQHINRFNKKTLNELIHKTKFKNVEIEKIVNLSVFFGCISFKASTFVDSIFNKLFPNKFGFILLASLKK